MEDNWGMQFDNQGYCGHHDNNDDDVDDSGGDDEDDDDDGEEMGCERKECCR